jgi:hypothetical protein
MIDCLLLHISDATRVIEDNHGIFIKPLNGLMSDEKEKTMEQDYDMSLLFGSSGTRDSEDAEDTEDS